MSMSANSIARRMASFTSLFLGALLALAVSGAAPAGALTGNSGLLPHASTGGVAHVRSSSAMLVGVVTPNGTETSYYFQYGPTIAYGSQTPTVVAGSGVVKVKVGQEIVGLSPGVTYHFRLVAVATGGKIANGFDRTFVAGGSQSGRLKFTLAKANTTDVFGSPFVISGTLTGVGGASHVIELQASPFPYLAPFVTVGVPGMTNAAGAFSFRVTNLTLSTQFRVITLDKLPIVSPTLTERLALHVILHVAKTSRQGFVRFYGTVAPAKSGTQIVFQVQQATRPHGRTESATRELTVASTTLKHGSTSYSRFSAIVEITKRGRYIAYVKLGNKGSYASGTSQSYVIRSTVPARTHRARKGRRKKG